MALRVTLHVRPDVAPMLVGAQPPSAAGQELLRAAEALGVAVHPLHPGVADARLATHFSVEVPDLGAAERAITRLRQCAAVEAAYLKPPEAAP